MVDSGASLCFKKELLPGSQEAYEDLMEAVEKDIEIARIDVKQVLGIEQPGQWK